MKVGRTDDNKSEEDKIQQRKTTYSKGDTESNQRGTSEGKKN